MLKWIASRAEEKKGIFFQSFDNIIVHIYLSVSVYLMLWSFGYYYVGMVFVCVHFEILIFCFVIRVKIVWFATILYSSQWEHFLPGFESVCEIVSMLTSEKSMPLQWKIKIKLIKCAFALSLENSLPQPKIIILLELCFSSLDHHYR